MQIVEIIDAVSKTGCDAAVEVEDPPLSGNFKLECNSFTAEFEDWVPHASDQTIAYVVKTTREVTVWHKFEEAMVADQRLVIGRLADGRWVTLVWPCP